MDSTICPLNNWNLVSETLLEAPDVSNPKTTVWHISYQHSISQKYFHANKLDEALLNIYWKVE